MRTKLKISLKFSTLITSLKKWAAEQYESFHAEKSPLLRNFFNIWKTVKSHAVHHDLHSTYLLKKLQLLTHHGNRQENSEEKIQETILKPKSVNHSIQNAHKKKCESIVKGNFAVIFSLPHEQLRPTNAFIFIRTVVRAENRDASIKIQWYMYTNINNLANQKQELFVSIL